MAAAGPVFIDGVSPWISIFWIGSGRVFAWDAAWLGHRGLGAHGPPRSHEPTGEPGEEGSKKPENPEQT